MKRVPVLLLAAAMAVPAAAQDVSPDDDGMSLMERGAQLFLDGLRDEMAPALEELGALGPQLRSFLEEMGPAMAKVLDQVQDWTAYHPPEILPNGDIIIRRRQPDPAEETAEPGEPIDI